MFWRRACFVIKSSLFSCDQSNLCLSDHFSVKWIRREYSTCVGSIMSEGRRRICCGTRRIVYIASFSNWTNVVVTKTIPQVDKARRMSVHLKYYVSLYIISLSRSLCVYLYCDCVFICVCYMYSFAWCLRSSLEALLILITGKVLMHHLWCFYENQIYDERIIVSVYT